MINGKIKLCIILICCCLFFSACSKRYSSSNAEDYEKYLAEVEDAELYMPRLEDLSDYESIVMGRRTNGDAFIDTTDTISLIVQYSEDDFDLTIDQIESEYEFINSPLDNYLDYEAKVNDYYFRVDHNSLYELMSHPSGEIVSEPKRSLIIGINRTEHRIAYLYYWDIEKNEMDDLDKFIKEKFVIE